MAKILLNFDLVPNGIHLFLTKEKRTILLRKFKEKLDVSKWDMQKDLFALSGLAKLASLIDSASVGISTDQSIVSIFQTSTVGRLWTHLAPSCHKVARWDQGRLKPRSPETSDTWR